MADPNEVAETDAPTCHQCPNPKTFKNRSRYVHHMNKYHAIAAYRCTILYNGIQCSGHFATDLGLRGHILREHTVRAINCDTCKHTFVDDAALKDHVKVVHKKRPFMCTECYRSFSTETGLETHSCTEPRHTFDWFTPDNKQYVCIKCYEGFDSPLKANRHYKQHHEITVNCKQCHETFTNDMALRHHQKFKHDTRPHPCPVPECTEAFVFELSLTKHLESHSVSTHPSSANLNEEVDELVEDFDVDHSNLASDLAVNTMPPARSRILDLDSADDDGNDIGMDTEMTGGAQEREQKQPLTLGEMLGPTIDASAQDTFKLVTEFVDRAYFVALPESPSPMEQRAFGTNMQAFHDAQYVDPLLSLSNPARGDAAANLRAFVQLKRLRVLWGSYTMNASTNTVNEIIVKNYPTDKKQMHHHEQLVIKIADANLSKEIGLALAKNIVLLLERMSTFLSLLADIHIAWAKSAALLMLPDDAGCPKIELRSGRLHNLKEIYYEFMIKGYDPVKREAWTQKLDVRGASLQLDKQLDYTALQRFRINAQRLQAATTYQASETGERARRHKMAFDFSNIMEARFWSYVGTKVNFINDAKTVMNEYLMPHRLSTLTRTELGTKWRNHEFFTIINLPNAKTGIDLKPILTDNMIGPAHQIVVVRSSPEKVWPVLNDMLLALQSGHDPDTVLGIGCYRADLENHYFDDECLILSCSNADPKHGHELHVCPECYTLVPHNTMEQAEYFRAYKICTPCRGLLEDEKKAARGNVIQAATSRHLKKENELNKAKKSKAELVREADKITKKLTQRFLRAGTTYYDAYADQTLNTSGPRQLTWDGCKLNPLYPSIEAIDPVVAGSDGHTAYHNEQNIVIISDAINRAKRHYPVLVLHAVALLRRGRSQGDVQMWESGISLFRLCLVNHYQYGSLAHAQQSHRVGQPVPSNFAKISQSFRQPLLLSQQSGPSESVADEHVFRFLATRSHVSPKQRTSFQHSSHEWLYHQLDLIAMRVWDTAKATGFRHLWLRRDSKGNEVFFPFSSYSIVDDWTEYDLMEWLQVRAKRNVTLCQRPHAKLNPIYIYSIEELFLTIANIWIRKLKADHDKGHPWQMWGADEVGLVPQPSINSLLCASLGHLKPGEEETLGLENFREVFDKKTQDEVVFDQDKCKMCYETQFCNFLKFKYAVSSLPSQVFTQLDKIRVSKRVYTNPYPVLPPEYVSLPISLIPDPFLKRMPKRIAPPKPARAPELKIELSTATVVQQNLSKSNSPGTVPGRKATKSPDFDDLEDDFDIADLQGLEPDRKTLQNLGATCYSDAIIHVLCNISELANILLAKPQLQLSTGRPKALLTNDADGSKHTAIISSLSNMCQRLRSGGPQVTIMECARLFESFSALTDAYQVREYNEASSFFNWLMDKLDLICDRSSHDERRTVPARQASGFLEMTEFPTEVEIFALENELVLQEGQILPSLEHHIDEHWSAYLGSGHDSILTKMSTIQWVNAYECDSDYCPIVDRRFQCSSAIILHLPKSVDSKSSIGPSAISLETLINSNFEQHFIDQDDFTGGHIVDGDRAMSCVSRRHQLPGMEKGQYLRMVTRITRAPPIVAIEINRQQAIEIDFATEDELDQSINLQRVANIQRFNMGILSNYGPAVIDKDVHHSAAHEHLECPSLNADYEITAIVAFNYKMKHFTCFVKAEDRWMYFDDLNTAPVYRDPFNDWPDHFIEHMLWYRREQTVDEKKLMQDLITTTPEGQDSKGTSSTSFNLESEDVLEGVERILHTFTTSNAQRFVDKLISICAKKGFSTAKELAKPPPKHGIRRRASQLLNITALASGDGNKPDREKSEPEKMQESAADPVIQPRGIRQASKDMMKDLFALKKPTLVPKRTVAVNPGQGSPRASESSADKPLPPVPTAKAPTLTVPASRKVRSPLPGQPDPKKINLGFNRPNDPADIFDLPADDEEHPRATPSKRGPRTIGGRQISGDRKSSASGKSGSAVPPATKPIGKTGIAKKAAKSSETKGSRAVTGMNRVRGFFTRPSKSDEDDDEE